jgi:prepilin-type N-terminal cleavage/methylation domain-containing protein
MSFLKKITYRKSFTLIELLIAVTIITVILLSIYSAFNTGVLSYKKIDASFDVSQEARVIFNRLEIDLKNSFPYKKDASLFKGANQHLDFFTVLDIYDKDTAYTEICRIKYQFDAGTLKRMAFVANTAIDENGNPQVEELSANIKSIDFQYASDDKTGKEAFIWQATWPQDDTQQNQMPIAVKIKLTIIDRNEKRENLIEFSKTIPIERENLDDSEKKKNP